MSLTITNQKFIRDGVHMLRCWDIEKVKGGKSRQVMTEMVDPNPDPYPTAKSQIYDAQNDGTTFSNRANTSGVIFR